MQAVSILCFVKVLQTQSNNTNILILTTKYNFWLFQCVKCSTLFNSRLLTASVCRAGSIQEENNAGGGVLDHRL